MLRRLEDEIGEQLAVSELKAQIDQKAAQIMEWLKVAGPSVATMPVGGSAPELRAQEIRMQYWQQQVDYEFVMFSLLMCSA